MKMHLLFGLAIFLLAICPAGAVENATAAIEPAKLAELIRFTVEPGHPWTPPFGLERVGRPWEAVVEVPGGIKDGEQYLVASYRDGREIGRKPVIFCRIPKDWFWKGPAKNPKAGRVTLDDWPSEVRLFFSPTSQTAPTEVGRATASPPEFEAEALAKPEQMINPVDLGTILPPHDGLLLVSGQRAVVEVAALNRGDDLAGGLVRAWYEYAPAAKVQQEVRIARSDRSQAKLELPPYAGNAQRDQLQVSITDGTGKELWKKTIPVMVIAEAPVAPRFGAVETKLRYDQPIPTRSPPHQINYDEGWNRELKDIVVYLPNGARFVMWRGASYCPFWASRVNMGLCHEWAEINNAKHQVGCVDCVEPLQDKELRYGRVKIVESTPARVHVRWDYQSCDANYKTWGEFAHEDYYFYPDGLGTRVMDVTMRATVGWFETQEFIFVLPQGVFPLACAKDLRTELLWPDGKASFTFPCRPGFDGQDDEWARYQAAKPEWLLHRIRLAQEDPLSVIQFDPWNTVFDLPGFSPFPDRGAMATPMYWGHHWPLTRGYVTSFDISERIRETPSHISSYHTGTPKPLSEKTRVMANATGESCEMTRRTFSWLIGMTAAGDDELRQIAKGYTNPPKIDAKGAALESAADFTYAQRERRALCMTMEPGSRSVELNLQPDGCCENPVFELKETPKEHLSVHLAGQKLDDDRYAWDGLTLWIKASFDRPTDLRLEFSKK